MGKLMKSSFLAGNELVPNMTKNKASALLSQAIVLSSKNVTVKFRVMYLELTSTVPKKKD